MASTSCQTTPSSASNSSPTRWDVFLSFRGTDTRYKFTSHLYAALDRHGVRTFKDEPGLRSGEVISEALLEAIQLSRCYIVIFSKNYASSPWCLDELVEIYNCKRKTMARLVIPVFYNIDPSVVRHQSGSFKEAFENYENRFSGETEEVKKWRLALTEVANFSGKHVSENRSEADIIDELIVDEILPEIDPKTLNVPKYAVGLDSRVKEITTLLSSGTEGVIWFGICGMGGVGKTTLAKALYNQLLRGGSFKASCFLANVREVTGTFKGVEYLQQKLINDVVKSKKKIEVDNVEEGIELIKARICSTKILVVVDDLGHHKQFENLVGPFAPGSIVIITTRSEDLLDKIDVESIYRCRVKELDDDMSLKLFTQHALGNAEPSSSLMVLTREILCHADGLPLALEVFGSYLYNQPEEGWKSFIKRLKRNPDSTIQQRLIISLDALESDDPMLKKMFLDIACFLIGSEKKKAVKLLGTYYSDTDYNIGILEKRCLLSIDDRNVMRMHDLLQDMGKEVSRNNSPNEPGKHSRLWAVEDIDHVLKKRKGKDVIEGIIPRSSGDPNPLKEMLLSAKTFKRMEGIIPCSSGDPNPLRGMSLSTKTFKRMEGIIPRSSGDPNPLRGMSLSTKTFKRMDNLRFLLLRDVDITGSFERKLENLRWLCWNGCLLTSFPSEFYPQKLVFLALPHSKLRTMQGLNMVFNNLKDLDMSRSLELTTTPDFTKLPCLETLNLHECRNLEKVHISIGILVKLVYLNLSKCVKIKSLPGTLCNLRALEVLDLHGCMSLEELPLELGKIESLKRLYMNGNENLRYLPDSICSLRSLETLQIHQCKKLEIFPEVYNNCLQRAWMLHYTTDINNHGYETPSFVDFQWDLYGEYEPGCIIV